MAKPAARIAAVQLGLAVGLLAVVARAAQLQIVDHGEWEAKAAAQRTVREELPARRGVIYDRRGVALAVTQEFYHVGIAPEQVKDAAEVARKVSASTGIPAGAIRRQLRAGSWIHYQGPFSAPEVEALRGLRGVHLIGEYRRFYPYRDLARPIVGRLVSDGSRGASGLELTLDSVLRGVPGEAVVLKDGRGRVYESPSRHVRDPVAGHDVRLTLDAELQEIAERALDEVIAEVDAQGGDVVFLDPHTGELLALASRQAGGYDNVSARASVFTDTYEPGSTAKLFTAAALLTLGRVDSADAVSGENGKWDMPINEKRVRRITDTHADSGVLTLAEAVEVSSNIAMVKFAERLTDAEQFEMLRGFGFGSPTGVEFPSEARGTLKLPADWNARYTRFSQAMGYEFTVTPLQLAAAYGAIANGGLLLSPTLVREVRGPDGEPIYTHRPEPVRRVVTGEVAASLREYLRSAADTAGTGSRAQLTQYALLGKTGTAIMVRNGRYVRGAYTGSYAAIFPADEPQLVIVVKIDDPKRGGYYGGVIAAPVIRTMLEQALASQQIALDRSRLVAGSAQPPPRAAAPAPSRPTPPVVLDWPLGAADSAPGVEGPVPLVRGAPLRVAVRTLHQAGLRVRLRGSGTTVSRTEPDAGATLARGGTVIVWTDE
jgi:cell division protein FtsI (penicillin-binding protein 3)